MLVFAHNAEARLAETLGEMREQRASWTVVLFHLSQLMKQYKNDYQINIAVNLVKDLLREDDGAIYLFVDGNLAVLCNNLHPALLNKLIFQLRYLYMDDPLAYTPDGAENPAFCTVYPLAERWVECMRDATRFMTRAARSQQVQQERAAQAIPPGGGYFGVEQLAAIEHGLQQADIMQALHRQPVCAITADGSFRRVFDELYISVAQMREMLHPEVDLLSNRWLFKYVTYSLDQRVLGRLQTNFAEYLVSPVSLNMNVETLLSEHFRAFDEVLTPTLKVAIVLEIPVVDAFADMAAFMYARDTVQKQGYRVCIDGLSTQSFIHVDRIRLGADLMKLQWNADSKEDLTSEANRTLSAAIRLCGNSRVILCRCDTKEAVEYGQSLGISLFQGRYLDTLIHPQPTGKN